MSVIGRGVPRAGDVNMGFVPLRGVFPGLGVPHFSSFLRSFSNVCSNGCSVVCALYKCTQRKQIHILFSSSIPAVGFVLQIANYNLPQLLKAEEKSSTPRF